MKLSVIIPSYRRHADLRRCLVALSRQSRLPDEVWVSVRDSDTETHATVLDFKKCYGLPVEPVIVSSAGVVHAMSTALTLTTGDVVALTDDDAEPWIDWLERVEGHFTGSLLVKDRPLGGVGGRDHQKVRDADGVSKMLHDGTVEVIGRVQWFGRIIGNHHYAVNLPAHEVDLLKGVNCAFNGELLRTVQFDRRMRGRGAEVHWELALCLAVKKLGYRLIFDPELCVDHYPAARPDGDCRGQFDWQNSFDSAHNETIAVMASVPWWRSFTYVFFTFFVGARGNPGLLQVLRLFPEVGLEAISALNASVQGRLSALRTLALARTKCV